MAGATSLLPYKDTKNNRENQTFPRLFSHKKAPSRHEETEAATDFRFSILIFGEHSSYPGAPMTGLI